MAITTQLKNQHLLWRAGFGIRAEDMDAVVHKDPTFFIEQLFKKVKKNPDPIIIANNVVDGLSKGISDIINMSRKNMGSAEKREIQKQNRQALQTLNYAWYANMIDAEDQLTEKMALFWHGHFACRVVNIFYQQQLLNIIRENALRNFGDLLREVSKSAAMLNFLNNQQNRKQSPNENFAREVMELFTLGRGNYTEQDIKEAARAFTGWSAKNSGAFFFNKNVHDTGPKTFLGKSGNLDGDDIIDILLQQKQTARYIVIKIWKFFVNESVADGDIIEELTQFFYSSNYNIQALLEKIFRADWFYTNDHIGAKIKSPIELLVGIERMLPMEMENNDNILYLQKALGQILFYPPNVAGWPGGKQWIDSSSLMLRLRIPRLILDQDEFAVTAKTDDDLLGGKMENSQEMQMKRIPGGKIIKADIEWKLLLKAFENTTRENLLPEISSLLLQTPIKNATSTVLSKFATQTNRADFIKSTIINLMSTPEYQMC